MKNLRSTSLHRDHNNYKHLKSFNLQCLLKHFYSHAINDGALSELYSNLSYNTSVHFRLLPSYALSTFPMLYGPCLPIVCAWLGVVLPTCNLSFARRTQWVFVLRLNGHSRASKYAVSTLRNGMGYVAA